MSTGRSCLQLFSRGFNFSPVASTFLPWLQLFSRGFNFSPVASTFLPWLQLLYRGFNFSTVSSTSLPCLQHFPRAFNFSPLPSTSLPCFYLSFHAFFPFSLFPTNSPIQTVLTPFSRFKKFRLFSYALVFFQFKSKRHSVKERGSQYFPSSATWLCFGSQEWLAWM
ncbi:hypothetical protein POVWA2_034960 [Plasmodium ovale wallikeri]|uniref:Uncharacterized protein n=1 Tax=Plasmodium ovale wallikeri TaxID=864142 RepID=A0A1A8Z077_PLAOA|nr:hypothetical protein POVWA1_035700 [Plasmodium ovale wallikeri]SBT38054.1 hypothetical protein POVWA2_034960 [Plasmodium ovale wallikeri]